MTEATTQNGGAARDIATDVLLSAYIDNELSVTDALRLEEQLSSDERLRARLSALKALRHSLHKLPDEDSLSPALQASLQAHYAAPRPVLVRTPQWLAVAAAMMITALATGLLAPLVISGLMPSQSAVLGDALTGHMRSLVAPQPFDVASSDRHIVRPWLTARLPAAPRAADLTSDGFVLVGARIDIVEQRPVPVLVYRLREHVISLISLRQNAAPPAASLRDGYNLRGWREGDFTLIAVSDLPAGDLERFQRAYSSTFGQDE